MAEETSPWLLLIHQLPPHPAYFRVKMWRQLQALGAVALKNSVYALPLSEETREDFQWMVRQIAAGGGEASVVEARFTDGLTDGDLRERFRQARDEDYAKLQVEIQTVHKAVAKDPDKAQKEDAELQLAKFRKRFAELQAIDFFEAGGAAEVRTQLGRLEAHIAPGPPAGKGTPAWRIEHLQGRTWVTRKGIHVDRIACAWLVRRFIDPGARFRFVEPKTTQVKKGELRFDMFEGEFTHEGDWCSFETLIHRLGLEDPALHSLAELIHDVDLKDAKFKRPEASGFDRAILGVALLHAKDEARLEAGSGVLDAFYAAFRKARA
ncbi:chromate resistance protein ChrB domain-containing protein [Geothrix oryzisoli]|uniref:chromate resistance protein ChrB domain-containing protein n=1 Tax=Geothrix oryzisoli TaxID=2922721 RepID=UPI001FACEA75|nr:chromate resistance protein ChrB domain-containing protein [Geothrix oryzisoli]